MRPQGKYKSTLDYSDIASIFKYEPVTGKLERIKSKTVLVNRAERSLVSVSTDKGNFKVPLTSIVWMLCYKEWPSNSVLFRDGDASNTSLRNLKIITNAEQQRVSVLRRNLRVARITSVSYDAHMYAVKHIHRGKLRFTKFIDYEEAKRFLNEVIEETKRELIRIGIIPSK